jgi:hypothetical protein
MKRPLPKIRSFTLAICSAVYLKSDTLLRNGLLGWELWKRTGQHKAKAQTHLPYLASAVPLYAGAFSCGGSPSTGLHLCAQIVMLTCFTYPPEITPYSALIAGGTHMAEYRAYLIGDDGHFYEAVPLTCADDAEAIEMAKKLVIDRDVELWQLDRKIGTFSLKQK